MLLGIFALTVKLPGLSTLIECGESACGIVHSMGYISANATVRNCTFSGNIIISGDSFITAGDIVCAMLSGGNSVENCTCNGNIIVSSDTSAYAGGIAGLMTGIGSITNCTILNGTTITCNVQQTTSGAYIGAIGGVVGSANSNSITNCTSYAVLEGNVIYKGGILGYDLRPVLSGNTGPNTYPQVGTDTLTPTPIVSPDTPLTSHKYSVFNSPMTWIEAKAYCESLCGHLATITNQEEQDIIFSLLSQDETAYTGSEHLTKSKKALGNGLQERIGAIRTG